MASWDDFPVDQSTEWEAFPVADAPVDSGQGYGSSLLSSAGRGVAAVVPGVIGGTGYLTGSRVLKDAATDIDKAIESALPINPLFADDFSIKAANALGQAGSMLGTGGVGGLIGKGLGGVRAGAQVAGLGAGFLQGTRGGGLEADRYGMTGGTAYARALLGGFTELATEKMLFGMGSETAAVRKLLGETLETGAGGFGKAVLTEGLEEGASELAGNVATKTMAPEGVKTPGITEGVAEATGLGMVGGSLFGGVNALAGATGKPEVQTVESGMAETLPTAEPGTIEIEGLGTVEYDKAKIAEPKMMQTMSRADLQTLADSGMIKLPVEPKDEVTAAAEAVVARAAVAPETAKVIEEITGVTPPKDEQTPIATPTDAPPLPSSDGSGLPTTDTPTAGGEVPASADVPLAVDSLIQEIADAQTPTQEVAPAQVGPVEAVAPVAEAGLEATPVREEIIPDAQIETELPVPEAATPQAVEQAQTSITPQPDTVAILTERNNAELPPEALARWTAEVYAAAAAYDQSGDTAALQDLTAVQRRRVQEAYLQARPELNEQVSRAETKAERRLADDENKDRKRLKKTTGKVEESHEEEGTSWTTTPVPQGRGTKPALIQRIINDMRKQLPGMPKVEIITTEQARTDPRFADDRRFFEQQGSPIERIGAWIAHSRGTVYMVADNTSDEATARRTLLHEVIGHMGINAVATTAERRRISRVVERYDPEMAAMVQDLFKTTKDTQLYADELLAKFAESYAAADPDNLQQMSKLQAAWDEIKRIVVGIIRRLGGDARALDDVTLHKFYTSAVRSVAEGQAGIRGGYNSGAQTSKLGTPAYVDVAYMAAVEEFESERNLSNEQDIRGTTNRSVPETSGSSRPPSESSGTVSQSGNDLGGSTLQGVRSDAGVPSSSSGSTLSERGVGVSDDQRTERQLAAIQSMVDEAARAAGYEPEALLHVSSSKEPFTVFGYGKLAGGEERFRNDTKAGKGFSFVLEGLSTGWFTSDKEQFPSWKKPDGSNVVNAYIKLKRPLVLEAEPFAQQNLLAKKKRLSDIKDEVSRVQNDHAFISARAWDKLRAEERELTKYLRSSPADETKVLDLTKERDGSYVPAKRMAQIKRELKELEPKVGNAVEIRARRLENKYADPFHQLESLSITAQEEFPDLIPGAALRAALLRDGYDGIVLEGTNADQKLGRDRLAKWVIPLEGGAQIKSAAPITYDDAGNVIPLSQRFNAATDDIRTSLTTDGYVSAVERGDMETAQKLVDQAAQSAMPESKARKSTGWEWLPSDPVQPNQPLLHLYHGSKGGIESFGNVQGREDSAYRQPGKPLNLHSQGIWLTENSGKGAEGEMSSYAASTYAAGQQDGKVYSFFANIKNPARVFDSDIASSKITLQQLQEQGYDGVYLAESGFWVSFSPDQLKSAEPVEVDKSGQIIPLSKRFNTSLTPSQQVLQDAANVASGATPPSPAVGKFLGGLQQGGKRNAIFGGTPKSTKEEGSTIQERLAHAKRVADEQKADTPDIQTSVRESDFGLRANEDERFTQEFRDIPAQVNLERPQQDTHDAAAAVIKADGREVAYAKFTDPASDIRPEVRIAGLMQLAHQYDMLAQAAQAAGNEPGTDAFDSLMEKAIDAKAELQTLGNDAGRNLNIYNTWARMSPDGILRHFERELAKKQQAVAQAEFGADLSKMKAELAKIKKEYADLKKTLKPTELDEAAAKLTEATKPAKKERSDTEKEADAKRIAEARADFMAALKNRGITDKALERLAKALSDTPSTTKKGAPHPIQVLINEHIKEANPNFVEQLRVLGIPTADGEQLAKVIELNRSREEVVAREKALQQAIDKFKPRTRKAKDALPKILRSILNADNDGILTRTEFTDVFSDAFELPKITMADRAEIASLSTQIRALQGKGALQQLKSNQLLDKLAMLRGVDATDAILGAWYANVLSGLSTQGVNVWGNGAMGFVRTLSLMIGNGNLSDALAMLKGMGTGYQRGWQEAKNTWRDGSLHKGGKLDEYNSQSALETLALQDSPKSAAEWVTWVLSLGYSTRYVFRAMAAADAVFWYTADEGYANLAINKAIRETGLKPGTPEFNAAAVERMGSLTSMEADQQQARDELKAAGEPAPEWLVDRRAWELRRNRRDAEINTASDVWADRLVLQQEPEGMGKVVSKLIGLLQGVKVGGVPILRPMVPFNRVVSNLFESGLDFAGVGILRGMIGHHLTAGADGRKFSELERRERFVAGLMGITVAGVAYALAQKFKEEEDPEFAITGFGPRDPAKRAQWQAMGNRPFSMKVGNQHISYAETPLGMLLAGVGAWMDAETYETKLDKKSAADRFLYIALAGLQGFSSQGVLSSVGDTLEIMTGNVNQKKLSALPIRTLGGAVPAQGLLRDSSSLFDDNKIDDKTFYAALVKDIPVLKSTGTRPALNVFGEPVKIEGLPVVRRFVTGEKVEPVFDFLGKHKLSVPALPATIEIGSYLPKTMKEASKKRALQMLALENGMMTPDQRYEFVKRSGELTKKAVEALRKAAPEKMNKAQTERYQDLIDKQVGQARKTAMIELVRTLK